MLLRDFLINDDLTVLTNSSSIGVLLPLMIAMFWIGFYPKPFTAYSEVQVVKLLEQSQIKKQKTVQEFSSATSEWAKKFYNVTSDELSSLN